MAIEPEEFLSHYGVKGMQWGVRKKSSAPSFTNATKTKAKTLTDAELKAAVQRLKLEKEYVQISKELNGSLDVNSFVTKHSSQAVNMAMNSITTALVGAAMAKLFKKGSGK
jgi:hypothetical protein